MSKINALKTDLNNANLNLANLKLALKVAHPHACPECQGTGGRGWSSPASRWEPEDGGWDDCPSCLERGLNPLDLNSEITSEEAEEWANNAYEGKYPSDAVKAVSDCLSEIDLISDNLYAIEYEEG